MGKLILEMQISMDGYMAGPEGQTDWMIWNWGPDWDWDKKLRDFHTGLTLSASHILISRQMAEEGFMAHWKQASGRKDAQNAFANHIAQVSKTVISTKLSKDQPIPGGWENVSVAPDLDQTVRRLKEATEGNILVYGGATLVSGLLAYHLIDEIYLLMNPVTISNGMTAFREFQHFMLKEATAYNCGVVGLHYLAKRDDLT